MLKPYIALFHVLFGVLELHILFSKSANKCRIVVLILCIIIFMSGKNSKYLEKTTPSPMSDIMEYVEAGFPNETITIISAKETPTKSSRVSTDRPVIDGSSMSPRRLQGSPARLSRGMSPSSSPRRMMEENDSDPERSNSPKTPPQNVACLTDIGTIVRRVRNVRVSFTPETRVFAYAATETCV